MGTTISRRDLRVKLTIMVVGKMSLGSIPLSSDLNNPWHLLGFCHAIIRQGKVKQCTSDYTLVNARSYL
jgi:hypothetical protein